MKTPLRVLFYAINGSGMGHVTRLLAIARELRELLDALDVKGDLRFLTTTEASGALWDFPIYKLPSHARAHAVGLDKSAFLANSRLLVMSLVASLHPDLLVTDTAPQGAFGEMSMLLGHARAAVFIDRHKDPSVVATELVQRHLPLYQRILVPDDADQSARYPLPRELYERRRFVGPVHGYDERQALDRQAVHEYFAIPSERRVLFISAGGGGDEATRADLAYLVEALAQDQRNHLLVGYGPLHRGDCIYRRNVIPLQETEVRRYFAGIDAAVSAAGYNSYQELLAARVPTAFYAQPKGMDRQDERVALGLAQGWHSELKLPLTGHDPESLRRSVEQLAEGEARVRILENLERRPSARGALRAAVELLLLHAAGGHSSLKRGDVFALAMQRLAWRGDSSFASAARCARAWEQSALSASARAERQEAAGVAFTGGGDLHEWAAQIAWGARLERCPEWQRLKGAWFRDGSEEAGQERQSRERLNEAILGLTAEEMVEVLEGSPGLSLRARAAVRLAEKDAGGDNQC